MSTTCTVPRESTATSMFLHSGWKASLATGTPVVTSPRAHAQIDSAVAACRVVERTPSAFAAAIRETLERPPAVARAERDQARAYVESERALSAWGRRMTDLYAEVMADP